MSIKHYVKSAEDQKKGPVNSASMVVVDRTVYITLIPDRPLDPADSAAAQARQIFATLEQRLATVGSDKTKVAHVTIWLAHLHDFDQVTREWNAWIDPQHPPARACAQVNMANRDIKVEMIIVASL